MSPTLLKTQNIQVIPLKNGATLYYSPMPNAPRLALAFYLHGGNHFDQVPGEVDLIDRLLMKGTKTRSMEDIAIAIDGLTLEVGISTRRDYTVMGATLLEEDLEASFELMADLFYNATLEDFQREKEKIVGEIQMELDSPKSRAADLLAKTIFGTTAYGTVGSVIQERLGDIKSLDNLKARYQAIYAPQNMVISAAGDVNINALTSLLEQYFPAHANGSAINTTTSGQDIEALKITKETLVTFDRADANQMHIYKGWLTPTADHPDYYPSIVMNTILGAAGLSSRLFLELRDKKGLAYNVRSSFDTYRYCGQFGLYIGTEPKNTKRSIDGFIEECQKLVDIPVDAKELAEAKENILGRRTVFLETAPQLSTYIGSHMALGRKLEDINKLPEYIQAVSAQDIQRVAQTLFNQPAVTAMSGPASYFP